jgi:prepilin-type N-terminal cleavage/methylation domain-containing protein
MSRTTHGFTLVELMIVVAIIGVLAAVAVGAYNDYIHTSQAGKVTAHFRVAHDVTKFVYGNAQIDQSQGRAPDPAVPDTSAGWVALIGWEGKQAPGGGPAFIAGSGDTSTGAIGVVASGSWAGGDSQVVITRPAFANLTTESVVVAMWL